MNGSKALVIHTSRGIAMKGMKCPEMSGKESRGTDIDWNVQVEDTEKSGCCHIAISYSQHIRNSWHKQITL